MGRLFTASNTQYFSKPIAGLPTNYPLTLAAWVKIAALPSSSWGGILGLGTTANANFSAFLFIGSDGNAYASGPSVNTAPIAMPAVGSWFHLAAVFTSASSTVCYVNGVASAAAATGAFTAITTAYIGYMYSGSAFPLDGNIAFPAIWNVALSAADITALVKSISPLRYHPQGLVAYPRLSDGVLPAIEPDLVSATGWTPTTSKPTLIANPPIYGP